MEPRSSPSYVGWDDDDFDRTPTSESWQQTHSLCQFEQISEAVVGQRNLQHDCNVLEKLMQVSPELESATLRATLARMRRSTTDIGEFFRDFAHYTVFTELHAQGATPSSWKVFDVPELLEYILNFLEPHSLLKVMRVSRQFNNAITTSTRLQKRLHLTRDDNCHLRLLFRNRPIAHKYQAQFLRDARTSLFWPLHHHRPPAEAVEHVEFRISLEPQRNGELRKIGDRLRRMFVTQPPVERLIVIASCCNRPNLHRGLPNMLPSGTKVVYREGGFTLGALHDVAETVLKEHKLCPAADVYHHQPDGFVYATVVFEGNLTVPLDHPIVKKELQARSERAAEHEVFGMRRRYLETYRSAKLQAHQHGMPIPTMAEWQVTLHRATDSS